MIFTHTHILRFASICPSFCHFTFSIRCFWLRVNESEGYRRWGGEKKSRRQQFYFPFYLARCVSFVFWSFSGIKLVLLCLSILSTIDSMQRIHQAKKNRLRQSLCACAMHKNIHTFLFRRPLKSEPNERIREVDEENDRWKSWKPETPLCTRLLFIIILRFFFFSFRLGHQTTVEARINRKKRHTLAEWLIDYCTTSTTYAHRHIHTYTKKHISGEGKRCRATVTASIIRKTKNWEQKRREKHSWSKYSYTKVKRNNLSALFWHKKFFAQVARGEARRWRRPDNIGNSFNKTKIIVFMHKKLW